MQDPSINAIICLENVSNAILAEKKLIENNFSVKVMPTPSGIKTGCGFCLRFSPDDLLKAADFLATKGFLDIEIYKREVVENIALYERVFLKKEKNE